MSKRCKLSATSSSTKKKPSKAQIRPKKASKPKKAAQSGSKRKQAQEKRPKKQPKKANPRIGSSEFYQLQQSWYRKLAKTGFKDLETMNPDSGNAYRMFNSQSASRLTAAKIAEKQHYYRRWTCYLAHNPKFTANKLHLRMAELWADGATWAQIQDALKPRFKRGLSDWSINKFLKEMEPIVKQWNKDDPRGLDYEGDFFVVPD